MTLNKAFRSRLRGLFAIAPLLMGVVAGYAQEKAKDTTKPEEKLTEVVITGSRIARPELDRLEPTIVVGSELFDQRGYADVGQALSELPSFGIQSSNATNTQSNFGIAQSFVDLYSLGSQRTLVLVDGRRFVSSNTASLFAGATPPGQQVDLNIIPTKLIDRVETISVGGAPIYGADAIAGTVNIIMKKNYEGLDVDGEVGVSNQKDAWNYRARVLGGFNFADGRGNITAVAEFSKADGLTGPSRRNFSENLGFFSPATPGPFDTVLFNDASVPQVSTGGVAMLDDFFYLPPQFGLPNNDIGVTNAAGQPVAFSGGHLVPYNLGTPTGNPVFWSGGDGIRLSQFSNLLSPLERTNIDTIDNFRINDHVNLFGETWFSETHGTNLIAQPAYNASIFGAAGTTNGMFKVPVNNPFLSAADQALIAADLLAYQAAGFPAGGGAPIDPNWNPNTFYVSRASTDLQSGSATGNQEVYRGVLGLNGDFSIGSQHDYSWEVVVNYGRSENTSVQPAYVFQNVQNALNAQLVGGQIVCAPGQVNSPIPTNSSTCAPLNIFGAGQPSAAAVAYITHMATAVSTDTQRDATANLSGDILRLPAGEWKGAIGFENRRESADFSPDSFFTTTPAPGQIVAGSVAGSYISNEFYGETLVPIFEPSQDIPALHQLEFEGAIRRVDNSIAGKSNTWTEGLRWAPVQDILFRGNRTISIRAPAITELFLPSSTSNEFASDPCDKNFIGQGLAPATRAANCAAAGIPAGFTSNVVNATVKGLTSGNPSLSPEKADSYTYGLVLRPRWTPRLSLSADWIDIKMTNAIAQLNLTNLMDECYDSTDFPNNPACSHFTRDPASHQVTGYSDGFINAGLLHFQGFTAGLQETFDLPAHLGTMQFRANYLDTKTLLLQVGSAAPINEADTLNQLVAAPKSKASFDLNYMKGPFQWYWQAEYYSMMDFNNQNTPTSQDILSVGRWWLINSTLTYDVTKALEVRLTVDNVFNKEPPYPSLAAGTGGNFASATSLYFAGIIGRTYLLAVDYRFK